MVNEQYFNMFLDESKENLESLDDIILKLESHPDDQNNIADMFRVAHTIKGMAGTMEFKSLEFLTHQMENLMLAIKNKKIQLNDVVDLLFRCRDTIMVGVEHIEKNGSESGWSASKLEEEIKATLSKNTQETSDIETKEEYNDSIEISEFTKNAIKKANKTGFQAYKLKFNISQGCMLKSARAFIITSSTEEFGDTLECFPEAEKLEDGDFDNDFTLIVVTKSTPEQMLQVYKSISELESVDISEITIDDSEIGESTVEIVDHKEDKQEVRLTKTVRVDVDRLDTLMNLVSELIIVKNRLDDLKKEVDHPGITDTANQLQRLTSGIHNSVMRVRMVPIEREFNRFPRLVRDLAKDLGKEVNLNLVGKETEIDRTIIDEIGEPLMHLIRNSMDHGIESAEERKNKGKDPVGTITLLARPEGNSVLVEVSDDGGGISIDKIKSKILNNGVVDSERLKIMSENDIMQYIFHSGFSTADKVSNISGRGVGLDVVKHKIEKLGGSVELRSELGVGSKFSIRLPLTLAIIRVMLVKVGVETYAIPMVDIREIESIDTEQIRMMNKKETILYRNQTVPLVRMHRIADIEDNQNKYLTMILTKQNCGVLVDKVIKQQDVVIKHLGERVGNVDLIAGATILGDGSLAMILDTKELIKIAKQ